MFISPRRGIIKPLRKAVVEVVEVVSEEVGLGNYLPQLLESLGIVGVGNVELQVAPVVILFVQMCQKAVEVLLAGEMWVVGKAILHRAAHNHLGYNLSVGLGDNRTIECAWRVVRGGSVVLHSLTLSGTSARKV